MLVYVPHGVLVVFRLGRRFLCRVCLIRFSICIVDDYGMFFISLENDEQILMLGCHGDGFYSTRGVRILTFFTP